MISVAEADVLIRRWDPAPAETWVDLADLAGRVLARDLRADRDGPPYDRVAMDGMALDSREADLGRLRIAGLRCRGPLRAAPANRRLG
ncbi:MAG: hypothetical protein P4L36_15220 [Holophaga sp.]|nr:hypothetical protein [Holophaga sp.]